MTFTYISLLGAQPRFMLTCSTTGDIPSDVIWMRDKHVLRVETSLLLINSALQIYNYSLEQTGRKEGLYTCIVTGLYNNASANIHVRGIVIHHQLFVST